MTDLLGEYHWEVEPWQVYIQVEPVRDCGLPLMHLFNLPESQTVKPVDFRDIPSFVIFHQLLISDIPRANSPLPIVPFRLRLRETRLEL
jgi:hypothetical protein